MPRLIIGGTSHNSARIWVRGDDMNPVAFLEYGTVGGTPRMAGPLRLVRDDGYTGVIELKGLRAATPYRCEVRFGHGEDEPAASRIAPGENRGRFRTAPAKDTPSDVAFLLVSCNLHHVGFLADPDPAYRTAARLIGDEDADFMIHCGDQIYADIQSEGELVHEFDTLEYYTDKYMDAWNACKPARRVLTRLPHYMVLDDHEIADNYARDTESYPRRAEVALAVYRRYQDSHNPQTYGAGAYHYAFDHGDKRFFTLDCRTQRLAGEGSAPRMIGRDQMQAFKRWLKRHKDDAKFVVSCVPFVAEVEGRAAEDKWCGEKFRPQREEIIDHIAAESIGRLTFLTGDMHNSLHASMDIATADGTTTVHELMSSPINQLQFSPRSSYVEPGPRRTTPKGVGYRSSIHEFYGDGSNLMVVRVRGDTLAFQIHPTKKNERAPGGSFRV